MDLYILIDKNIFILINGVAKKMKSKTTLTISKEVLGKVKAIAFDNGLNQSQVIESYVKYCLENDIEVKVE